MKKDLTTTLLQVALGVILLASVICCLQYVFASREVRALSAQIAGINSYRATMQAYVSECVAYADKNPAINPLLESIGIKRNVASPKAAK